MSKFSQQFILDFFNKSWSSGIVPKSWKEAIVVPILKPGKLKFESSSYRPIALTSNWKVNGEVNCGTFKVVL